MTDHHALSTWLQWHPILTKLGGKLSSITVGPDSNRVIFAARLQQDFLQPGLFISFGTQFQRSLPPEFADHDVHVDHARDADGKFFANGILVTITKRPAPDATTSAVTATVTVTLPDVGTVTRTTTINTDGDQYRAAALAISAAARDAATATRQQRPLPPSVRWGGSRAAAQHN